MSIIHLQTLSKEHGHVPLCGHADWEGLTTDPDRNECWECASIADVPQPMDYR